MKKHTILFLAANPSDVDRLALDREARAIQVEMERSGHRDRLEFVTRWAVQPLDLLRELRKLKPTIVHFSGHGVAGRHRPGWGLRRDIVGDLDSPDAERRHGLFFQGQDGRAQFVSTSTIEATFEAAGNSVKLVVLSACHSDVQAEALLACVDCVIGMTGSISDDAARSFAIGFYGGLCERESVEAAYLQGCAAISLEGLPDSDRPQLQVREGVDASRIVLVGIGVIGVTGVTRDELLSRLSRLLPSQFEEVLFRASIPISHVGGFNGPQTARAIDVIRYLEQQNQLDQLARIIDEMITGSIPLGVAEQTAIVTPDDIIRYLDDAFPNAAWDPGDFYVDKTHFQTLGGLVDLLDRFKPDAYLFRGPQSRIAFDIAVGAVRRVVQNWEQGKNGRLERDSKGRNPLATIYVTLRPTDTRPR